MSFPSVVAGGPDSCIVHYLRNDKVSAPAQFTHACMHVVTAIPVITASPHSALLSQLIQHQVVGIISTIELLPLLVAIAVELKSVWVKLQELGLLLVVGFVGADGACCEILIGCWAIICISAFTEQSTFLSSTQPSTHRTRKSLSYALSIAS